MQLTFFTSFISLLLVATEILASPLASPLTPRGSEEALGNIQYLTTSWQSYTASLRNISRTYHVPGVNHGHPSQQHYNTSLLSLEAQYAVIAVVSSYNQNFRYENYVMARISQGPVLGTNESRAVVKAIRELLDALKPLFEAFFVFEDVIGKESLDAMLGLTYQGQVGLLIDAVQEVVAPGKKDDVGHLGGRHDKIVAKLREELGV